MFFEKGFRFSVQCEIVSLVRFRALGLCCALSLSRPECGVVGSPGVVGGLPMLAEAHPLLSAG